MHKFNIQNMFLKLFAQLLLIVIIQPSKLPFFSLHKQLYYCSGNFKLSSNALIGLCIHSQSDVSNALIVTRQSASQDFFFFQNLLVVKYIYDSLIIKDGLIVILHYDYPNVIHIFYRQSLTDQFAQTQIFTVNRFWDYDISQNGKYLGLIEHPNQGLKFYEFNEATNKFQYDQTVFQSAQHGVFRNPKVSNYGTLFIKHYQGLSIFTKNQYNIFYQSYELTIYGEIYNQIYYMNFQYDPIIYTFLLPQKQQENQTYVSFQNRYTVIGQFNMSDANNVTYKQITKIPYQIQKCSQNMRWMLLFKYNSDDKNLYYYFGRLEGDNFKMITDQSFQVYDHVQTQFYYDYENSIDYLVAYQQDLVNRIRFNNIYQNKRQFCETIPFSTGREIDEGCECFLNTYWNPYYQTCTDQETLTFLTQTCQIYKSDPSYREQIDVLDCVCAIGYQWSFKDDRCRILCNRKEPINYEESKEACECKKGYVWDQDRKFCLKDEK